MSLDVAYWLDSAAKLIEAIMAATSYFPLVGALSIWLLCVLIFMIWSEAV